MKKIFAFVAVAAAIVVAGNANAQLGIHVGYAPQTYNTDATIGSLTSHDTISMNGFFAGAGYNVNLTGDLNLNVGLNFRYNTGSDSTALSIGGAASGKVKKTNTQMLIEVPILLNYGLKLNKDLKVSAFAGPTVSFALSGKTLYEGSASILGLGGSTSSETNWYADNNNKNGADMKRFDIALTLGLAVDFQQFRLFGGYNMGLMNLSPDDGVTKKGHNLFIGLGYNL